MPRTEMAEPLDTEWCPTCGAYREVADRFSDVVQHYAGQHGVWVTQFYCGHSTTHEDGSFYPFP